MISNEAVKNAFDVQHSGNTKHLSEPVSLRKHRVLVQSADTTGADGYRLKRERVHGHQETQGREEGQKQRRSFDSISYSICGNRQRTSLAPASPLEPIIRQSNANPHEVRKPIFVIRNKEISRLCDSMLFDRQVKPYPPFFHTVDPHTIIITFLLCQPAQRVVKP